jgi:hypothetical protein
MRFAFLLGALCCYLVENEGIAKREKFHTKIAIPVLG